MNKLSDIIKECNDDYRYETSDLVTLKKQKQLLTNLINQHGDIRLSQVIKHIENQFEGFYECPKCHGLGTIKERYNAYPTNLPDSGWVEDWKYREIKCDLCNGHGYTRQKYVPKTKVVVEGYEIEK